MSSVKYSKEQIKAIENCGSNLLVSASAGSGKTTVLIERIIHHIKVNKWNVDELLIVTFTEAAAFELKQRLRVKLTQEILENSTNKHLRIQLPKLANAQISTFHSFCNQVIKRFFYLIDFDAVYKISDDVESFMIASEVLDQLFEDFYEENNPQFMLLVNRFSPKTHDDDLKQLITDFYFKMSSLPFKEQFKEEVLKKYHIDNDIKTWTFYTHLIELIRGRINEAKQYFIRSKDLAGQFNHAYYYQSDDDLKILEGLELRLDGSFDDVFLYLKEIQFGTFKSKCDEIDEVSKELIKQYRDKGKDIITKDLLKKYFLYRERSQIKFIKENKVVLEVLFNLIECFNERFLNAKRDKNLVDFSDLEEFTLKIFSSNNFSNEATSYYRNLYKEILIDEFQDTNSMQETIIKAISKGNNLFMVGDVKQSIYRFRSAEPEIFQQKYKKYQNNNDGVLVNLNANYRSRQEVIDFINYLFYQLMDESLFEIEYNEAASLVFGQKDYLSHNIIDPMINLHILEKNNFNMEKKELEAHYVAQKIRELIDNKTLVYDSHLKDLRTIKYKDIVILSRTKSDQDTYNDMFKLYNIPFLTAELSGYFNSIEVLTITSILKVIDNPLQDIPLVATLRSPIFQINEQDLIKIKINSKEDYYFDKIFDYLKTGTDEGLVHKLKYFVEQLEAWRESIKNEPLSELIFNIYHKTNYYDFVLGQVGGKQRQANLDLLYDRAKNYEHLTSNSLFKFIQLINFLNEHDKDLPQARTVSDNEDLVRFMSIHKSKGLEFPIVFVTNLNKKYNTEDEKSRLLFDKDLGIAFSYVDIDNRVKYETLYQSLVKEKLHRQMLAEELRLMYVALTRAKERLYLVGTVDDFSKEVNNLIQIASIDEILLPNNEREKNDYLSLILISMSRHPSFNDLLSIVENKQFQTKIPAPTCNVELIKSLDKDELEYKTDQEIDVDFKKYMHEFSNRLNYKYPHYPNTIHFAKQTIADFKVANSLSEYQYQHEKMILKTPKFIDKNKANATLRGTSIHLFMQHINYNKDYTLPLLHELKQQLQTNEIMSEEQLNLIDLSKINCFLQSELAQKIRDADRVNKEMPFTTLVSSQKIYPDIKDEVGIMVQGVVDLLIEFKDTCLLIDFKSDRINDTKEEINRIKKQYKIQVDIYKEAMERIYNNKLVSAYLYLFEINQFVRMDT